MRKLTFALSFLLLSITGFSQEYWNLPPEGSIYTHMKASGGVISDIIYLPLQNYWGATEEIDGENWTSYHEVYYDSDGEDVFYFRSENGVWYFKNTDFEQHEEEEFVMYDWTASVGDTILSTSSNEILYEGPQVELRVDSIQMVTLEDGSERKKFYLDHVNDELDIQFFPIIWIEGIGAINQSLTFPASTIVVGVGTNTTLICAEHGGQLIYETEDTSLLNDYENCHWVPIGVEEIDQSQIEVFPNPVENILSVRKVNGNFGKASKIEITDLHGRIVLNEESAGGKGIIELDLSSIDSGIYLLRMKSESGKKFTEKIVVN